MRIDSNLPATNVKKQQDGQSEVKSDIIVKDPVDSVEISSSGTTHHFHRFGRKEIELMSLQMFGTNHQSFASNDDAIVLPGNPFQRTEFMYPFASSNDYLGE
jgi:hypothetical protein